MVVKEWKRLKAESYTKTSTLSASCVKETCPVLESQQWLYDVMVLLASSLPLETATFHLRCSASHAHAHGATSMRKVVMLFMERQRNEIDNGLIQKSCWVVLNHTASVEICLVTNDTNLPSCTWLHDSMTPVLGGATVCNPELLTERSLPTGYQKRRQTPLSSPLWPSWKLNPAKNWGEAQGTICRWRVPTPRPRLEPPDFPRHLSNLKLQS